MELSFSKLKFFWPLPFLATMIALFLSDYLSLDMKMILGLWVFTILILNNTGTTSNRLIWVLVSLLILSLFIHLKFLYTLCLFTFLLLFIENTLGKMSILSYFILFIISPLYNYITSFFSFDIRMQLSTWVVHLFNLLGLSAESKGSLILFQGKTFAVDPACAGLHMLSFSLILGVFLINYWQQKKCKKLNWVHLFSLLIVLFVFIIITNLFRIAVLTYFSIPEAAFSHQLLGILALLFYTLIPFFFLARFWVQYFGRSIPQVKKRIRLTSKPWQFILIPIFILSGYLLSNEERNFKAFGNSISVQNYKKEWVNNEVLKLSSNSSLVYLKMVKSFYGIEHNPLVCWKGSGMELTGEKVTQLSPSFTAHVGMLKNDTTKLYTAWWFDNGSYKTASPFSWRWKVIKGEPHFYLVNVTAESIENLKSEIEKIVPSLK